MVALLAMTTVASGCASSLSSGEADQSVGAALTSASGASNNDASRVGTDDPTVDPASTPTAVTTAPAGPADSHPADSNPADSNPTSADPASGTATPTATELAARTLPATPEALARELTEVEGMLGRAGLDAATAGPWGRRQQLLYRVLSSHLDWVAAVTAQIDPSVHDVVALNWDARVNLSALVASAPIASDLPAWDIRAPKPADELIGYYQEAAQATGVPWPVLAAVNLVETRMGRINGVSTAGAVGPMQFLPSTWARCCTGDPADDHDAIIGAGRYLADRGARSDLDKALFSYNRSKHYVQAVKDYAAIIEARQQRYYGFHAWEVVFQTTLGLVQLPVGYHQAERVDTATWLQTHPEALVMPAP